MVGDLGVYHPCCEGHFPLLSAYHNPELSLESFWLDDRKVYT